MNERKNHATQAIKNQEDSPLTEIDQLIPKWWSSSISWKGKFQGWYCRDKWGSNWKETQKSCEDKYEIFIFIFYFIQLATILSSYHLSCVLDNPIETWQKVWTTLSIKFTYNTKEDISTEKLLYKAIFLRFEDESLRTRRQW